MENKSENTQLNPTEGYKMLFFDGSSVENQSFLAVAVRYKYPPQLNSSDPNRELIPLDK
jgi:hypothetical protein